MTKKRSSSADLGGRDETLTLIPWTEEQQAENERLALRKAERMTAPGAERQMILEMLGLVPYEAASKERNETPIAHGTRGGYTNRGCRCFECRSAQAEYFRVTRAKARAAKQMPVAA